MTMIQRSCIIGVAILAAVNCVFGFTPVVPEPRLSRSIQSSVYTSTPHMQKIRCSTSLLLITPSPINDHDDGTSAASWPKTFMGASPTVIALLTAFPAHAATGGPVASALVAYAHYACLLVCMAVLVTERLTVKPNMSFDEEELLWKADALYGLAGFGLAVSGYYRVVEYGKGWDFYQHEPLFWLKLVLVGIWGASSFFPTVTILKRVAEQRQTGDYPVMSEKLASRMTTVINSELLALATMPLAATFMSRGVLYNQEFPWQVGVGAVVLTFGGFGFRYVNEALTWTEDEVLLVADE